jgi:hypothetical protein
MYSLQNHTAVLLDNITPKILNIDQKISSCSRKTIKTHIVRSYDKSQKQKTKPNGIFNQIA